MQAALRFALNTRNATPCTQRVIFRQYRSGEDVKAGNDSEELPHPPIPTENERTESLPDEKGVPFGGKIGESSKTKETNPIKKGRGATEFSRKDPK